MGLLRRAVRHARLPLVPGGRGVHRGEHCYGERFATLVYPYLDGLDCRARVGHDIEWRPGSYLFNVVPVGDAFTHRPEQAKEFIVVALDNGRFTAQPSNRVLFTDKSFTAGELPPGGLRVQTETWYAE